MLRHISVVHSINIITLGDAAVMQIGDTNSILARNRAIAVQREIPYYFDNEAPFEAYETFQDDEITIPTRRTSVRMRRINENPFLVVGNITISGVQDSATFHIGNIEDVTCNSRVKQIRQYIGPQEELPPTETGGFVQTPSS